MTEGTVTAVSGGLCRVEVNGTASGFLPWLPTAGHLTVDFDAHTTTLSPPLVGDRVLVAFSGTGMGWGWILGRLEGESP